MSERRKCKFKKAQADLDFLVTCRDNGLIPKFLNFKLYKDELRESEAYRHFQQRLLLMEIVSRRKDIHKLNSEVNKLTIQLKESVYNIDFIHLNNFSDRFAVKENLRVKAIHAKKLHQLGYSTTEGLPPDKVLFNFSSRRLTKSEESLLSKGLKFAFPPKSISLEKYLLNFENLYKKLNSHTIWNKENPAIETFKDRLRSLAFWSFNQYKKQILKPVLSDKEQSALKSLSKDKTIIIARPDKGNGVVLMDKTDYTQKVNTILSDSSKFKPILDREEIKIVFTLEDKINNFLQKLRKKKAPFKLKDKTYKKLSVSGSQLGILYGLPKVHKEGCPIRPILSACNTTAYNIAKYLVPIINPITKNKYTALSSFSFAKEICELDVTGKFLASFDIKSLFTNIPLKETIDIIIKELFPDPEIPLKCSLFGEDDPDSITLYNSEDFRRLLELATFDNYFLFNGTIYNQVDGVAMGSPLGPTLANAFMCHMESKWLKKCPLDFKPAFYRRYVDDCFVIFNSESHVELFLDFINGQHQSIQFTYEKEVNNILPFLDLKVERKEAVLTTSIYRKPTFTGLLSKFDSFTPMKYKENLIATLINRGYKLCSSFLAFDNECNFLKSILTKNGYPLFLIEQQIRKVVNKLYTPFGEETLASQNVPKAVVYFPTQFLGPVSDTVSKKLHELMGDFYPQISLRIVCSDGNTIGNRFNFKDKVSKLCMSNIVYKYTCEFCKEFYIGKTCRQFRSRIREHQGLTIRRGNPCEVNSLSFSEVRRHCHEVHNCEVNPDRFDILAKLRNENDLECLESLFQRSLKPKIINQVQSIPLLSYTS